MVYKRKGSPYWQYRFAWGGHTIRVNTKQGNKRAAELMEAAHKTELAKNERLGISNGAKAMPTLMEFADRFRHAVETECSEKPQTVSFYAAKLRYLLADPMLPHLRLDEIDEAVIDAYKQRRTGVISRRKKPMSAASVNRELATLRKLLRKAETWKIITRTPKFGLLRGEHERDFVLSFAKEAEYLNAVSGDLKDIAVLMIDTGLRVGEVLKLAVSDVRLTPAEGAQFGFLNVRSKNAKNSKGRNVPLTPRVSQMLESRITEEGLVFHRPDGSRLATTTLTHKHRRVSDSLKLSAEFVPHSFRHTYGTRLGESGADAFTIMKLMGHSSITISQRYVHPTPETVENAVGRMHAMSERKRAAFVVA